MASKSLGTLTIDMVARTGGFIRGMDKAERNSAKWKRKVKKNLDDVGVAMKRLAVVGVAGLTASFAAVVRASGRQADAIAQVEQRIKSTGGVADRTSEQLQAFASAMQDVTTFGDEAVLEMQSMLLTFTNIRGEIFDKTVPAILDLSVAMDQDLRSSVVQLGKALNDPVANLGALSRTGIQFSEEQKETIKTLAEMGRLSEAQAIVLEELQTQFGGAAEAAGNTFTGALQQVQNAFGDLLENPSGLEANKQALQDLTDFLTDPDTVRAANDLTQALIEGFTNVASAVRETVGLFQFLGEEAARLRFGAASDDLVRLNQELDKAKKALAGGFTDRLIIGGTGGLIEYWDEDELRAEIAKLEKAIAAERKRLADQVRLPPIIQTSSATPSPASPSAPASDVSPSTGLSSGGLEEVTVTAQRIEEELFMVREDARAQEEEAAQAHSDRLVAIKQTGMESQDVATAYGFSQLASATRAFAGEQSDAYKAMFAISKAAAIAESIVNIQAAIAKAANLPFPANLGAMATVAAKTASIVGNIQAVSMAGQAHDGLMSVPKTGTYLLEKGERVTTADTSAKLDKQLDNMQAGGGVRIINSIDPNLMGDYMGSSAGEKVIMNTIRKNQRTVQALATA